MDTKDIDKLVGSWRDVPEGATSSFTEKQIKLLESLKVLLEGQMAMDIAKIQDLHEKQNRMKTGGGK